MHLLAAGLLLVVLFGSGLALFTRHNAFPYFYHPDEPGKAEQVLSGKWNFHHPLLMLQVASKSAALCGTAKDLQSATVAGRWVSAGMASLAIVALTLLAYLCAGTPAAIGVAFALLLHHQLFELSHYFKEDTALLAGVSLCFLAIAWFWRHPRLSSSLLLGLACAAAVSAKYVGGITILIAIAVLAAHPASRRQPRYYFLFFAALLLGAVLVNLPALQTPSLFNSSFDRELKLVVHGQDGMTRSVPHAQYWNVFRENSTPLLWLFLAIYVRAFYRSRSQRSFPEWMMLLFPFLFALILSFSPKSNDRYFLPATACFIYLGVLGALEAADLLKRYLSKGTATALCLSLLILAQLPSFARYWQAFQHDDRAELRAWVEANLPPDAVVLQDPRAGLPASDAKKSDQRQRPLVQKVVGNRYAADYAPYSELKAKGITHVAASESSYGRYFLDSLRPQATHEEAYQRSRSFYEQLFREGRLLWSRDRGTVIYLHPGVKLYEITTPL